MIDHTALNLHCGVMTSHLSLFVSLTAAVVLTACASVATRLPEVSQSALDAEKVKQQEFALKEQATQTQRLMNISWPVLKNNAVLCGKIRPGIGVKTHDLDGYSKSLRNVSAKILNTQPQPTIMHVIPGSPAHDAGLKAGDTLLSAKGIPVHSKQESFWSQLTTGQELGLSILRGDTPQTINITPVDICAYDVRLRSSLAINAYADGRNITFTSGMMNFAADDDELAMIVGHELAHNSMGHIRKIIGNRILSGNATRFTRPFESEADYVGLYYQVRAGYNPDKVENFWRRLSAVNPKSVARAKSHPTFPDRFLRLAATREEIKRKQEAGVLLLPNFLTSDEKK